MSFTFGKFKGRSVADVATSDASYLSWVLNASKSWDRPMDAGLRVAIEAALGGGNSNTASSSSSSFTPSSVVAEDEVNFGKYKGQPLPVLLADIPYCTWVLNKDFFKRNKFFDRVRIAVAGPDANIVTSVYTTGNSGIAVTGDGGEVTFGKYKGQPLSTLLADTAYCKWIVENGGDKRPRHYDKIVEAASKAVVKKITYSGNGDSDHDEDCCYSDPDDEPFEEPDDCDYGEEDEPFEAPDE